jgi:hypothetical protein
MGGTWPTGTCLLDLTEAVTAMNIARRAVRDRVDALDGVVEITSPPRAGTLRVRHSGTALPSQPAASGTPAGTRLPGWRRRLRTAPPPHPSPPADPSAFRPASARVVGTGVRSRGTSSHGLTRPGPDLR